MSRQRILTALLALALCFVVGYVNVKTDETGVVMGCLLIAAFTLGFVQPKAAWRWGLIVGLTIPASYFVGFALNIRMVDPPRLPITLAVLVIPALAAAYLGVLFSRAFAPIWRPDPR